MNDPFDTFTTYQIRACMTWAIEATKHAVWLSQNHHSIDAINPYINKRLAYLTAYKHALNDDDNDLSHSRLYMSVFSVKIEGVTLTRDFGLSSRLRGQYLDILSAVEQAAPFYKPAPSPSPKNSISTPDIVAAVLSGKNLRKKGASDHEASMQVLRSLRQRGLYYSEPLPCSIIWPRLRDDGDWMIAALRRWAEALLETVSTIQAVSAFISRYGHKIESGRSDKIDKKILPIVGSIPVINVTTITKSLSCSQKAALASLNRLEEDHIIQEISGQQKWKVWQANDERLSLSL